MAINTQSVIVDLNTGASLPIVHVHQNDTNRQITFKLFNEGRPYTPSSTTVKFALKSPTVDGNYTVISGSSMASGTVSGNTVTFTPTSAYTAVSGIGLLTMILTTSSNTLRPVNILFYVQNSADGASTIAGASDFPSTLEGITEEWLQANISDIVDDYIQNELGIATVAETKSYLGIS